MTRLPRYSRWQLLWRSLLAAPFALSLVLTLDLGPAMINSVHASFTWLAVLSLVAALLLLGVAQGLLIPVGVVTFLVFPVLAGLGFNFAPDWARPIVVIIFYGSMLASAAATLTGVVVVIRSVSRTHPRGLAIVAGGIVLLMLAAAAPVVASAPSSAPGLASGPRTEPVNMGPVINTGHGL